MKLVVWGCKCVKDAYQVCQRTCHLDVLGSMFPILQSFFAVPWIIFIIISLYCHVVLLAAHIHINGIGH